LVTGTHPATGTSAPWTRHADGQRPHARVRIDPTRPARLPGCFFTAGRPLFL